MPIKPQQHRPHRAPKREDRPNSAERGYDGRWRRFRLWFLAQPGNQLCHACKRAAATVIDHIIPHRGDERLMWDVGNMMPLCAACHNRATARYDGGFGRPVTPKPEAK